MVQDPESNNGIIVPFAKMDKPGIVAWQGLGDYFPGFMFNE
jgi:hypothetical protein